MQIRRAFFAAFGLSLLITSVAWADTDDAADRTRIPTGQFITPLAAPGSTFEPLNPHLRDFPDYTVGQAMSEALSPDGKTLLILTTGYNRLNNAAGKQVPGDSNEYVFVYDVSGAKPEPIQVIQVPDTFAGIAFAPDGAHFYVSGGQDDVVHVYTHDTDFWIEPQPPIKLGHTTGNGIATPPVAAGLAVTADGKRLVVANYYNDSVSVVDVNSGKTISELDLRPGKSGGVSGMAGGENPFWVSIKGNATAYVGSQRDREVDVVDIVRCHASLTTRISVKGTPSKMLLDAAQDPSLRRLRQQRRGGGHRHRQEQSHGRDSAPGASRHGEPLLQLPRRGPQCHGAVCRWYTSLRDQRRRQLPGDRGALDKPKPTVLGSDPHGLVSPGGGGRPHSRPGSMW